jgi:hypothetical protein
MGWLQRLLNREPPKEEAKDERMHCIRFMTERGEQVGILLTTEEFERAIQRWVDTVDHMPIETADPEIDERLP